MEENELIEQWCVVANVKQERSYGEGGLETKDGVKHFRGGAKVYIIGWYPGMAESIIVIGQHRKSRKFIKNVIKAKHVENLRVKLVYSPKVLEIIENHIETGGRKLNKEFAETMKMSIPNWN